MKRTIVINVVGLSESLLGPHTPRLVHFRKNGVLAHIAPPLPAVTCTAQSNYLTATPPAQHGIVGNGWYDRDLAEVHFWKQSNRLVRGQKLWEELRARDPKFTCAKLFWWFNMHSTADYSVTPRPMYPADGRKVFDIHTHPSSLRTELREALGAFPFPGFWGPAAGRDTPAGRADCASRWIARSAMWIEERFRPTLNLVYLPHLDYNLQRLGPGHPDLRRDLVEIDTLVGELIDFSNNRGVQVMILSEYGITAVDTPVHLNRLFRARGWITVREELGRELLDPGGSRAFAVADHQVAHIYINDPSIREEVHALLKITPGIAQILGPEGRAAAGLDHARAGDLIAVAHENAWFTYYYWLDDDRAPDFARTVDIHRKPGYDPVELFLDPAITSVKLRIARRLLQKKLGFRMLMDVIPLDATLVKGSHGARPASLGDWPLLITRNHQLLATAELDSTDVYHVIKRHLLA